MKSAGEQLGSISKNAILWGITSGLATLGKMAYLGQEIDSKEMLTNIGEGAMFGGLYKTARELDDPEGMLGRVGELPERNKAALAAIPMGLVAGRTLGLIVSVWAKVGDPLTPDATLRVAKSGSTLLGGGLGLVAANEIYSGRTEG